jgi:hypothetical protein
MIDGVIAIWDDSVLTVAFSVERALGRVEVDAYLVA